MEAPTAAMATLRGETALLQGLFTTLALIATRSILAGLRPTERSAGSRMCGRYVITSSPAAVRRLFNYREMPNFPPRYNVAPTQPVPVVLQEQGVRHFH